MGANPFRGLCCALSLIKIDHPAGTPGRRDAGTPGRATCVYPVLSLRAIRLPA